VALEYETTVNYGSMSRTTFVAAASGAGVIRVDPFDGGASYELDTLADWTADAAWADDTGSLVVRANAILLFNDTESSADMVVPAGTWTLPDGSAVGATITVEPFRSVVLITDDPVGDTPPYYAASGIDWRAGAPSSKQPDLTINGIQVPRMLRPGKPVTVRVTIGNEGDADVTGTYAVSLFLDGDLLNEDEASDTPDARGVAVVTMSSVHIPDLPSGNYSLEATVDTYDAIPESDEENNTHSINVRVK
jgi:hypothetical protein